MNDPVAAKDWRVGLIRAGSVWDGSAARLDTRAHYSLAGGGMVLISLALRRRFSVRWRVLAGFVVGQPAARRRGGLVPEQRSAATPTSTPFGRLDEPGLKRSSPTIGVLRTSLTWQPVDLATGIEAVVVDNRLSHVGAIPGDRSMGSGASGATQLLPTRQHHRLTAQGMVVAARNDYQRPDQKPANCEGLEYDWHHRNSSTQGPQESCTQRNVVSSQRV